MSFKPIKCHGLCEIKILNVVILGDYSRAPVKYPLDFNIRPVSNDSIEISWNDISTKLSLDVNQHYNIRYTRRHNGSREMFYANSSEPMITLDDLQANSEYEISIRMISGESASAWSIPLVYDTVVNG